MIRYQLRLQPDVRYSFHGTAAPLTKDTLEQVIEGAIVHDIQGGGFGYPAVIDLQLDQQPDYQALNSILMAAERCGYQLIEGEVTQWVDAQAQGALVGCIGGAGCGAPTKNEGIMLGLALAGAFLGHLAGAQVRKHEVIYQISRPYSGAPVEMVPVNDAKAPTITLGDWLAPSRT
jgi:hypothetical protein